MKTTDYLDTLKKRLNCRSWYQLGQVTGWSDARISNWRRGNAEFDDEAAIHAARLLDLPPGKVLADIHAARAKTPEIRSTWEGIARAFSAGATALTLAFFLLLTPAQDAVAAHPASAQDCPTTTYYVKWLKQVFGTLWRRLRRPRFQVFRTAADTLPRICGRAPVITK